MSSSINGCMLSPLSNDLPRVLWVQPVPDIELPVRLVQTADGLVAEKRGFSDAMGAEAWASLPMRLPDMWMQECIAYLVRIAQQGDWAECCGGKARTPCGDTFKPGDEIEVQERPGGPWVAAMVANDPPGTWMTCWVESREKYRAILVNRCRRPSPDAPAGPDKASPEGPARPDGDKVSLAAFEGGHLDGLEVPADMQRDEVVYVRRRTAEDSRSVSVERYRKTGPNMWSFDGLVPQKASPDAPTQPDADDQCTIMDQCVGSVESEPRELKVETCPGVSQERLLASQELVRALVADGVDVTAARWVNEKRYDQSPNDKDPKLLLVTPSYDPDSVSKLIKLRDVEGRAIAATGGLIAMTDIQYRTSE